MSISKIDLGGEVMCLRMDGDTVYVDHSGYGGLQFNNFINKYVEFIKDDDELSETFLILLSGHRHFLSELSFLSFATISRILGYIKKVEDEESLG